MFDFKIVQLMSRMDKAQLRRLEEFVDSPYFNKNGDLRKLYRYLQGYFSGDVAPELFSMEGAYQVLFDADIFKKEALIKLMSKLYKLAEQFIVSESFEEQEVDSGLRLLAYYQKNHHSGLFEGTFKRLKKQLEKPDYEDIEYYFNVLKIEEAASDYYSVRADFGQGDVNFQHCNNALDEFYICNKLDLMCLMKNRALVLGRQYSYTLSDWVDDLDTGLYPNNYLLKTYHAAWRLLSNPNEEIYYKTKHLVSDDSNLHILVKCKIFSYLENTAQLIFSDRKAYYKELFQLNQIQLDNGVAFVHNYLLPTRFRNTVQIGLNLGELVWVEQYIAEYGKRIIPDYAEKEDIVQLCTAMLKFEKKDYDGVLDLLNQYAFSHLFTKMDERRLRLKTYYELDLDSLFEGLVNSFRKFLHDNQEQLSKTVLQLNRNFLNYMFALSRIRPKDQPALQKIETDIRDTGILPEKEWLLQKIAAKRK
jgi:hypothetical protein